MIKNFIIDLLVRDALCLLSTVRSRNLDFHVIILKKEKDFAIAMRKESSSIITGPNLDQSRRHAG
jgi:hypothetical protein